jgi:hypothetical protein
MKCTWKSSGTWAGIVEEFVSGEVVESPSVQCRINPVGEPEVMSTHDQILGGEGGQVYLGAVFPAKKNTVLKLARLGERLPTNLNGWVSWEDLLLILCRSKQPKGWKHYPIEINLRKGALRILSLCCNI